MTGGLDMDDMLRRGEPSNSVYPTQRRINVPPCAVCGAHAFMGKAGKRFCHEHLPGIEAEFQDEIRKVMA